MIVDTDITNCTNCMFYIKYVNPPAVLELLHNPGPLMACNGVKGFGIVGPTFYCTKHEYTNPKGNITNTNKN